MQPANFFSILGWIITGSIAGYIASIVLRAERQGCFLNIALGIAGAFVGAFVINTFLPGFFEVFRPGPIGGFLNGIIHAIFGAILLLVAIELILPGRQLGVRREERKSKRRR